MSKNFFLRLFLWVYTFGCVAQAPQKPAAEAIYSDILQLNFLGSVLYVAAHPDDENTRLIAYFSNKVHARVAYLSLTRGDGGQNLIGSEIRELLGVIRTNELLQARRIDGGEQFFTRANDFGFSKHPGETLRFWNKDTILKDMVKVIREFRPDIIINRFNANSAGKTHGHHTSSAILSEEAFKLAGDPGYKVQHTTPWKPKRLFFNTSWWFYGSPENFEKKVDKSKLVTLNSGVFLPVKGLSNTEIAALSRSMHKSQGFGSTGTRGDQPEYLELLKGSKVSGNPFKGIDTSWGRVAGGARIGELLGKIIKDYDFTDPSKSITDLLKVYNLIDKLKDPFWKAQKLKEVKQIILSCAGMYVEAVAARPGAVPGTEIGIKIEMINRSNVKINVKSINFLPDATSKAINRDLKNNQKNEWKETIKIGENTAFTSPYWLWKKGSLGLYRVTDPELIGKPLSPPAVRVFFDLLIEGVPMQIERPVVYKYNDPVRGEVYRPFEIIPAVTLGMEDQVVVLKPGQKQKLRITVKADKPDIKGNLTLMLPESWKVEPESFNMDFDKKGEVQSQIFTLTAPDKSGVETGKAVFYTNGKVYDRLRAALDYEHIPNQSVLLPAEAKFVSLDVKTAGKHIGYIPGAGDKVPETLMQLGYDVQLLEPDQLTLEQLKSFDAVITGIRAYNISAALAEKQKILFEYVQNGGTLIVQYNTNRNLKTDQLAPYMLHLSRDRVAEEDAKVNFIDPDAAVLNFPNKITQSDFDGWIQERGLYFAGKWDKAFKPVLSMHDHGEKPKKGSLLIARYGKGYYVYTGLSFFRELPAGVPGAYRLFANLIALGK